MITIIEILQKIQKKIVENILTAIDVVAIIELVNDNDY